MNQHRRTQLRFLAKLLVGGLIFWFVFSQLDGETIFQSMKRLQWRWIALGLATSLASLVCMAAKWRLVTQKFGVMSLRRVILLYWAADFLGLFAFGSVGSEAYKMTRFARRGPALIASLADRMYSFLWYGLFFFAAIITAFLSGGWSWWGALMGGISYGGAVLLFVVIDRRVRAWCCDHCHNQSVKVFFESSQLSSQALITHAGLSVLFLIFFTFTVTAAWRGAGLPVRGDLLLLAPVVTILLSLPITIEGIGVREFIFVRYAEVAQVVPEAALSASLILMSISILYKLLGVLPWMFGGTVATNGERQLPECNRWDC